MSNQYVNKVVQSNGTTLIDISDTTAVAADVASGKYFYLATGEKVEGTSPGGSTAAISVVDTFDSHGGTVREITALDISDTTAVASDVAIGKYFYTANGTKTAGANSGGGSSAGQSATGTISGSGTNVLEISCNFEPDLIHVYTDMSDDVSKRGVVSFMIIKDSMSQLVVDASTSNITTSLQEYYTSITGYGDVENAHGTYSNGTLTLTTVGDSGSLRFLSGQTYTYELKTLGSGAPSATAHTIYFEFSDGTDTTITAYYDDSFISSAITATTPSTYGQKTVDSASLDGVEWYERPTETWETIINDLLYVNSGDPYGGMWISDLGDVAITVGSEWRVTFDGTPYTMTATANGVWGDPYNTIIGNPLYAGGTDDGSAVPFCFAQNSWGAWTGWTDTSITQDTNHAVKIERLVIS